MEGYTQINLFIYAPRPWLQSLENSEDFIKISLIGLAAAFREKIRNHIPAEEDLFFEFEGIRTKIEETYDGFWLRDSRFSSEDTEVKLFSF